MDAPKTPAPTQFLPDAPISPRDDETLLVKPRCRQLLTFAALLGAALSAVLFVVLLTNMLGKSISHSEIRTLKTFCCQEEALMVLRAVNLSVHACEDFYGHVCSRANNGDYDYMSPLLMVALRWSFMAMAGLGSGSSPAALLLGSLSQGFWEREHISGKDVAEYAAAIVQASVPSREFNSFNMLHFLAQLSFKYGIPAVLPFNVSEDGNILNIEGSDDCFSASAYEDMLPSVLQSINTALNTSVSAKQLLRLKDDIATLLNTSDARIHSTSIEISPLPALSQREWAAILNDMVFPMHQNVTTLATRKLEGTSHLLDILANGTLQPLAQAYIAVCAALKTRDAMNEAAAIPGMTPGSLSCSALNICELEHAFMAEIVNSVRLNDYVRALFVRIKERVILEAQMYPIFYGITSLEITGKLSQIKLVLPEEIALLDIAVPAPSEYFAANLLAARAYTFDVRRTKIARGIPDGDSFFLPAIVRHGNAIYLPTSLFALLAQNHRRDVALDLPAVGIDMAAQCWSFLLESAWSEKPRLNIESRLHCIEQNHSSGSNSSDPLETAAAAFGLVSAVAVMTPLEWNVMNRVNNTEISLARLVFLLWAYNNCDNTPGVATHFDVNLAVRNSRAFRAAFSCSQSSLMAQRLCCLEDC